MPTIADKVVRLADGTPHFTRMDEMSLDSHLQPLDRQAELQLSSDTHHNIDYDKLPLGSGCSLEYFETLRNKAGTV